MLKLSLSLYKLTRLYVYQKSTKMTTFHNIACTLTSHFPSFRGKEIKDVNAQAYPYSAFYLVSLKRTSKDTKWNQVCGLKNVA